jgi:hypothetical protein
VSQGLQWVSRLPACKLLTSIFLIPGENGITIGGMCFHYRAPPSSQTLIRIITLNAWIVLL